MSEQRLQKALADAGVASRRRAEQLILDRRVTVNGQTIETLGTRVDVERDRICVDGRRVNTETRRYYIVYKPRGVVSTTHDPHAKQTVLDLVKCDARLFPVGRLDSASEGLLLLTNDGALAQRMLHPSFEVPRMYNVAVNGRVEDESLAKLVNGVELAGETVRARSALLLEQAAERSVVELVLTEGRRHQIREMMQAIGHPVRRLVRVRFGPLSLRGLSPGQSRPLRPDEREALQRLVREPAPERQAARDPTSRTSH